MVKEMFQQAKIKGNFSNHSLRATCATQLYDAGVPEAGCYMIYMTEAVLSYKNKLDTSQLKLFDFMKG